MLEQALIEKVYQLFRSLLSAFSRSRGRPCSWRPDSPALRAGTPDDLEELDPAPPDDRAFFARFLKDRAAAAAASYPCLYLFKEGPLDVGLRSHPSRLAQWEGRREGARRFSKLLQEALPQMKPDAES